MLFGQPKLHRFVPVTSLRAGAEEVLEAQVVRPLLAIDFDGMQMSDSMPRSGLEDEDMPSCSAGVAAVEPTGGFQRGGDEWEVVVSGQADREIDDRFGEETENRRGADLLDATGDIEQVRDAVTQRGTRDEPLRCRPTQTNRAVIEAESYSGPWVHGAIVADRRARAGGELAISARCAR